MNVLSVVCLFLALVMLAFAIRYLIFLLIAKRALPNSQVARVFSEEWSRNDLEHLGLVRSRKRPTAQTSKPFVSILVACYNEIDVIDRLMKSFLALTYGTKNFEIIIVDDSNDGTFERLQKYSSVPNLKIFHRTSRDGWKGGALNLAVRHLNMKSRYALIIDADHVVEDDLLDKCVQSFARDRKLTAVQGFPIPSIGAQSSWVSRGVFFRWVRRNLVEFVAKEQMALPMQLTGSLFMIRSDVLREIEFSNDLTEDWELTLALYLQNRGFAYKRILFHPFLNSHCEAPTELTAYFRQRSRVSEGHTRGFKKRFVEIISSPLSIREKVELLFTGMNYAKFLAILALVVFDCVTLLTGDINPANTYYLFVSSLAIQVAAFFLYVGYNMMSVDLLGSQYFNQKDVLFLTALNLCTFAAMVIGSIFGLIRQKGTFYKSKRKQILKMPSTN